MDSKKLPLWLVFENADPHGKDLYVIFKDGDDLRQDMLTLQMFKIMDNYWRRSNLNLLMIPYGCISTGDELGFIEVVLDSDTTANITGKAATYVVSHVYIEQPVALLILHSRHGRQRCTFCVARRCVRKMAAAVQYRRP